MYPVFRYTNTCMSCGCLVSIPRGWGEGGYHFLLSPRSPPHFPEERFLYNNLVYLVRHHLILLKLEAVKPCVHFGRQGDKGFWVESKSLYLKKNR